VAKARGFETHARTVSAFTLLSRTTGLARDAALSRVFGVGVVTDAFAFAFMVPNLFRRLFGEGALTSSFLPVYSKLEASEPAIAAHVARLVLSRTAIFLSVVCLIGEGVLIAAWPDSSIASAILSAKLVAILLPYMPLVCLVALIGAVLQVHGRFGPTAAAPVILNLAIVVSAVGLAPPAARWIGLTELEPSSHIVWVAASVLVAGVLQLVWSLLALRAVRLHGPAVIPPGGDESARMSFRQVIQQAVPMAIGLGVLQVNTFIDGLIASYPTIIGPTIAGIAYPLDEGAMASLSFAQRLYEFPLGVFGISVATAIFPQLAREANDLAAFRVSVARALRLVVFIGLPASIGLMLVRTPLTAVVFQGESFTAEDTARVATILLAYAPAIWAYSANHLLTRAFYARGESMTPVKVAAAMVALNFVLNITLIWTPLRTAGLALSTAVCAVIQMAILMYMLSRRTGVVLTPEVRTSWLRTALAAGVMAITLALLIRLWPQATTWSGQGILLGVSVAVGGGVFLLAAKIMRMPELAWALGKRGQSVDASLPR